LKKAIFFHFFFCKNDQPIIFLTIKWIFCYFYFFKKCKNFPICR